MVFGRTWRTKPLEYLGYEYLNLYDVDRGYFHVYFNGGRTYFIYPEMLSEENPFIDFEKQEKCYSIKVGIGRGDVYRDSTFVKLIKDEDDAMYIKNAIDLYRENLVKNGEGRFLSKIAKTIGEDIYVIVNVSNKSYLNAEKAFLEHENLNDCKSCVRSYGVYMIYHPGIEGLIAPTALIREDYLRLGSLAEYLKKKTYDGFNYTSEIAHKIGIAVREMIESGYGHTSLHEDNIVIKKDDDFIVKITDGSDMYKLDEGDVSHLIITKEDGIRMTIASALLTSIRFLMFSDNYKRKNVVDEFLYGLLEENDNKLSQEIKKRIEYIGDREMEIVGKICDELTKEYFV